MGQQSIRDIVNNFRNAMRREGMDADKMVHIPMFRTLLAELQAGRMDSERFLANCRKLLIFNPDCRCQPVPLPKGQIISAKVIESN